MTNEMRTAVTDYMFLPTGNEMGGGLELHYPIHPMLDRAYGMLKNKFEQIIVRDQDLLSNAGHQAKFIKILPMKEQEQMKIQFAKL
jgi:hypothetical protein